MIAEEIKNTTEASELSEAQGKTLEYIKICIIKAILPFKIANKQLNIKKKLNEIKLTQLFIWQINCQLVKYTNIIAYRDYSDIFSEEKGIPDIYFINQGEGKVSIPLFLIEVKRLPTPNKKLREKEYIIGHYNNGGIERFKKEIHGKNYNECGMIGFIEKYTPSYWLETINTWILEQARMDSVWNQDEQLSIKEIANDYNYLTSIVHRIISKNDVLLNHWWIIL